MNLIQVNIDTGFWFTKCLIKELQKLVIESDDKQIQTDVKPLVDCQSQTDLDSETLLEYLYQFNDEDKVYIISKGWSSIEDQNKLVIVYDLINKMEHEMQCDLYTLLEIVSMKYYLNIQKNITWTSII